MKKFKWRYMTVGTDKRLQRRLEQLTAAVHNLAQKYGLTYIDICTIKTSDDPCITYRAAREKDIVADAYTFDRRSTQHD